VIGSWTPLISSHLLSEQARTRLRAILPNGTFKGDVAADEQGVSSEQASQKVDGKPSGSSSQGQGETLERLSLTSPEVSPVLPQQLEVIVKAGEFAAKFRDWISLAATHCGMSEEGWDRELEGCADSIASAIRGGADGDEPWWMSSNQTDAEKALYDVLLESQPSAQKVLTATPS
jgi:hypothetical protein